MVLAAQMDRIIPEEMRPYILTLWPIFMNESRGLDFTISPSIGSVGNVLTLSVTMVSLL